MAGKQSLVKPVFLEPSGYLGIFRASAPDSRPRLPNVGCIIRPHHRSAPFITDAHIGYMKILADLLLLLLVKEPLNELNCISAGTPRTPKVGFIKVEKSPNFHRFLVLF